MLGRRWKISFARGLILGYLIDSRSDISVLRKDCQDLAEEYESLRDKLAVPVDDNSSPALRDRLLTEREKTARDSDDCVFRIRQRGHPTFLQPPRINDLLEYAVEGYIVIVNVTAIRSDAIIVSRSGIRPIVSLPKMDVSRWPHSVKQRWARTTDIEREIGRKIGPEREPMKSEDVELTECLAWLWSECVKPILAEIERDESTIFHPPRVWWIDVGTANRLPFHAAGANHWNPRENALSRVISSYTPMIKSLGYARSFVSRNTEQKGKRPSILMVTMPETPGEKRLEGVIEEARIVQKATEGVYEVKELRQPSTRDVLTEIRKSNIVHFACHGSADIVDPFNSSLLLQSDNQTVEKLTVRQVSETVLIGRAWIAYLSACSTAEAKVQQLADEALHLVSGFQVAGFGHVIGSLWAADDSTCVEVARVFYECLVEKGGEVENRHVAEALRHAILYIRSRHPKQPSKWAPYIHLGA